MARRWRTLKGSSPAFGGLEKLKVEPAGAEVVAAAVPPKLPNAPEQNETVS